MPLFMPPAFQIPPPTEAATGFKEVAALMEAEAKAGRFGGIALVVKDDKIVFEQASGLAQRSAALPISRDTRFDLASLGKLFTTIAIGQLMDAGKVRLDDPLTKFLPEQAHRPGWSKVTVRHLLAHSSGFGNFFTETFYAKRNDIRALKDYFPIFEATPLAFEPGSKWAYSNVGFILLGTIVERASGEEYCAYVQKHIFDAAGMADSGFFEKDEEVPRLAIGYTYLLDPEGRKPSPKLRTSTQVGQFKGSAAGGSISTGPDLIRFAQALMHGRLVKPATLSTLTTPVWPLGIHPDSVMPSSFALGFMVYEDARGRLVGHSGSFPGAATFLFMDPSRHLAYVLLANVDPQNPVLPIHRRLQAALPRD